MIAGTALAALAVTSAYGLQKTRQAERMHTENMKVVDKLPQRAQRFPAVSPHVLLEDPNTYQRHFDVYKSSPTRTYIGGKGVYAITGFPK